MEKKARIVLLNWILVLSFFILLALAMFFVKFYLESQTNYMKTWLEKNKPVPEKNIDQDMLNKINSFNLSFEKLNTFYRQKIYLSEVLEKISSVLPEKLYLTGFSVSPDLVVSEQVKENVGFNIFVSGFSSTREEVLQLEENMKKNGTFKDIYFPITNLVKATNIDFSLTFKIAKP